MAAWEDLFVRIRECVLGTFTQQIIQYEEDCRRLEQQRNIVGWNYCQFFTLKETLTATYCLASLDDEALLHYDELEALFNQTLIEQGAPWFRTFGGTAEKDDSKDFLTFSTKGYKELIVQNSISIFDFKMYLFAKQASLLMGLGQPNEVCKRAKSFIASLGASLDEYRVLNC